MALCGLQSAGSRYIPVLTGPQDVEYLQLLTGTISITVAWLHHCLNLSVGHVIHRCVIMCVCAVHVNPFLTVPHVASLTVPAKTAPVGSNPFEDDEDEEEEEEMATKQQTTVNHISVKKEEEIKTLVNRRKHSAHPQPPRLLYFCFNGSPLEFLCFRYFACNPLSSLRWQVVMLLCMVSGMALHTKPVCVSVLRS